MSTRDDILDRVRRNQPAPRPLPELPTFGAHLPSPLGTFRANLIRMGGRLLDVPEDTDLSALIGAHFRDASVICSATPEVTGNRVLLDDEPPAALENIDVSIVRAAFGVAETGSVWLSERELHTNAIGFLSQHLVVLLDPCDIVGNLHEAYRRPEFSTARYGVLMTGPSATADIEGVLIHGAQGVRSLTVMPVARK